MRRTFTAAVLVLLALAAPASAVSPLISTRYRLVAGDPDRNWTYVHTFDGSLEPTWTASGLGGIQSKPLYGQHESYWDSAYGGALAVPANTTPGVYNFDCGRGPELAITVVSPPKRKVVTIAAGGESSTQVQQALYRPPPAGFDAWDVVLLGGLHEWSNYVVVPAKTRIRGYGATLVRRPGTSFHPSWPFFVIQTQDVTLEGATFIHPEDTYSAITGEPGFVVYNSADPNVVPGAGVGLVVKHCTFEADNLGLGFSQTLVQDCRFHGGGAGAPCPGGLYYRCIFEGPSIWDPIQYWGGGAFQMVCCDFRGTVRGPVFNAGNGCPDTYFSTVTCRNIVYSDNTNEIWLCEAGTCDRFLCFHARCYGCESSIFQFDRGASGVFIRDFMCDLGIVGAGNGTVTNYTLQDFQIVRGGITVGTTTTNANFVDGAVINFQPSRAGQEFPNPSPEGYLRKTAVINHGGASNALTRVKFVGIAPGYSNQTGFTNIVN